MDNELRRLCELDTPSLNPQLASGLATSHLSQVEAYLNQIFIAAAKGFPEGLVYVGCKRCSPSEDFAVVTRLKGVKRSFDVARSDLYMMQYFFKYKGEDLPPRYIFLPFVSDAGTIHIGGSRFNISPVLSDRVISIGVSNIFVKLLRDKLTFERESHHIMIDGKRETIQITWSGIYHKTQKMKKIKPTIKANSTMMHYLLCKYGFTDTFLKFGNCEPIIGGAEINSNTFPEAEWNICTSTQVKPKGCGRGFYEPTLMRVAIRKEQMTPMVKNMLGGFFYIVDHFPARVLPHLEFVNAKRLWMVLLGHIYFSGNINEGKLHDDIADHMASLDDYLDGLVVMKLKEIGIKADDIYQLFAVVIEHFSDWLLEGADKVASMYDKELSVLYYVLYDITSAVFKLYFKLKAASKKVLTVKDINNTMNMILKPGLIYAIIRTHGEVSSLSSSGDNKAFKITSILVPQSSSSKLASRKDRALINDPAKKLHVSVAEVGLYSALPKSEPSGRSRLALHLNIGPNGEVLRNPKFIQLLDETQALLGG